MTSPLLLVLWLLVSFAVVPAFAHPEAKLTVKVLDEDGQPIADADVGTGFEIGNKSIARRGRTNGDGIFSASGETTGYVSYGAGKTGYYHSYGKPYVGLDFRFGRWQPWNPMLELMLKKIVNPVPMYARRAIIELPSVDKEMGFDLEVGDWVKPWGNGIQRDFVFRLTRRFASRDDYEAKLQLSFSHEGDGVRNVYATDNCGSELRLPRSAPEDGYEAVWSRTDACPNAVQMRPDQNYCFRVRTETADGKVHKALYGKIHGEIRFDVINSKTAIIIFTYYLNPDGTRNLEFDQKRNLFQNLKSRETPH